MHALRALQATLPVALLCGVCSVASDDRVDASLEYTVKAAFVYQFARFVTWPAGALAPGSAFEICILGDDLFADALLPVVKGKMTQGHALIVRRFARVEDLQACPMLFVASAQTPQLPRVLARLRGSATLTVSDADGFVGRGGMIELRRDKQHVRFAVDVAAAEREGLRLSSQLIEVAQASRPAGRP